MSIEIFIGFSILCASIGSIQSVSCPNIQTVGNFTAGKYMGKWYEIEKYPMIFEAGQKCITAEYTLNSNGTVTVHNSGVFIIVNIPISITGLATADQSDAAKLTVKFKGFGKGNYWVIDTDYDNYSLVYSCIKIPFLPLIIENAWILGRNTSLDSDTKQRLKDKLSAVNSPTFLFMSTDQTNCEHNM